MCNVNRGSANFEVIILLGDKKNLSGDLLQNTRTIRVCLSKNNLLIDERSTAEGFKLLRRATNTAPRMYLLRNTERR